MATQEVTLPTVPRELPEEVWPEGVVAFNGTERFTKVEARRYLAHAEKRFEGKSRSGGSAEESLAALDAAEACRRASRHLAKLGADAAPVNLEVLTAQFRAEILAEQQQREAEPEA
jgi:hypothetical protein